MMQGTALLICYLMYADLAVPSKTEDGWLDDFWKVTNYSHFFFMNIISD